MKEELKIGMSVFFIGENLPMEVKALSARYAIVTRNFDKDADEEIIDYAVESDAYGSHEEAIEAYKDEVIYSILDFQESKKAPNDNLFNPYDYRVQEDIDECLSYLISGEAKLSRRNAIDLRINWDKTLNSLNRELERAKKLKGKKLSKNEIFLIEQFWNDENYILKLYSECHGIGYKHVSEGAGS